MGALIVRYFTILLECFEYDIYVFKQMWIYYWVLIPAIYYLAFFFLKWVVLTAPVWLPFGLIFRIFQLTKSNE